MVRNKHDFGILLTRIFLIGPPSILSIKNLILPLTLGRHYTRQRLDGPPTQLQEGLLTSTGVLLRSQTRKPSSTPSSAPRTRTLPQVVHMATAISGLVSVQNRDARVHADSRCSELFDQEWKVPYGGAEPFWGLFDQNRNLKPLTIPTCLAAAEAPVGTMGSNDGGGATSTGTGTANTPGSTSGSHSGASSTSPLYSMVLIGAISMLFAAVGGAVALL
jgi:hypothetical protein